MKKVFRYLLIGTTTLILLVILLLSVTKANFEYRLNKRHVIQDETFQYMNDSATLAKGKHIASLSCFHCHGDQLQGTVFIDDPALGKITAPNLTRGKGGIGSLYSREDMVRAIRHGVRPGGQALMVMPSLDFFNLSDEDLAAVISYIESVPPADNNPSKTHLKPLTKILMGAGMFGKVLPVEYLDHRPFIHSSVPGGITPEYGNYLASTNGCKTCHGDNLGGGQSPEPGAPFSPNLTMGNISIWSEADFLHALHTGERPGGQAAMSKFMPWATLGRMTDDELRAIWVYIKSVPQVETNKH